MKKALLLLGVLAFLVPALGAAERVPILLTSCRDLLCTNATDVFLVGEGAYIDYNSSVKEISYWAQLTFPDGTKYQITFPNRITSNTTGNYIVEMVTWKDGYEETRLAKVVRFVDSMPEPENPSVLDWPRFLLSMIAGILTVLVVWRVYTHMKRPKPAENKDEHKKTRKRR